MAPARLAIWTLQQGYYRSDRLVRPRVGTAFDPTQEGLGLV